jgi:hypothetical protein
MYHVYAIYLSQSCLSNESLLKRYPTWTFVSLFLALSQVLAEVRSYVVLDRCDETCLVCASRCNGGQARDDDHAPLCKRHVLRTELSCSGINPVLIEGLQENALSLFMQIDFSMCGFVGIYVSNGYVLS